MIPVAYVTEWRSRAPWTSPWQVEHDLILSRALVSLFREPAVSQALAFRGGTALHKLYLAPAARYSEDLDLVQLAPEPIGPVLDGIRRSLDPWLGSPRRVAKEGRIVVTYRMLSEGAPAVPLRLKIEISTVEHFTVYGIVDHPYAVTSRWYTGTTAVRTYHLDELLATKLRALYQRQKGRDLFDLYLASCRAPVDHPRLVHCFERYLAHQGLRVSRAELELNLREKLSRPGFLSDVEPLLAPGTEWRPSQAMAYLAENILPLLTGAPWRGAAGDQ